MTPAHTKVDKKTSGMGITRKVPDVLKQDTRKDVLSKVAVSASGIHAGRLDDHTAFHRGVKIAGIVVPTGCIERVAVLLATI